MKPKHIVVIMTDHQRYDTIGLAVDGIEVTPNLNQLAKEGMTFERNYNACPLCVPARTALATGKYPTANGVVYNDWAGETATDFKTIHGYLQEAGFTVCHAGVDHIRTKPLIKELIDSVNYSNEEDYGRYIEDKGIDLTYYGLHKRTVMEFQGKGFVETFYSDTKVSSWVGDESDYRDTYFTKRAMEMIDRNYDNLALFINYWAPHPPLVVPKSYMDKFRDCKIIIPDNVGKPAFEEPANRRMSPAAQLADGISGSDWDRVWRAHYALCNYVDNEIGRVIQALKNKGIYDETMIVFTSDHGDHLGQHSMYQKMEMYEEAVHVPLIIKDKRMGKGWVDNVTSHLDLCPTILDAAGIRPVTSLDGLSLYDITSNELAYEDRIVFGQYSGNPCVGTIRRAAITKGFKYVYDNDKCEELYDLKNDPQEMINVADKYGYDEVKRSLFKAVREFNVDRGDWVFEPSEV